MNERFVMHPDEYDSICSAFWMHLYAKCSSKDLVLILQNYCAHKAFTSIKKLSFD
jgi:hypothetical protein